MEKNKLDIQKLWEKFIPQLEKFKDTKVIIEGEERLYGYYQTAESPELDFEEGETALTPQQYAEAERVDHISWHDNEILIDTTKCIEDESYIDNCVKAEFILDDFTSKLEDYVPYQYDNDTEFYAEDYIEDTLSDYYTVPELIEEEGNNATKTLKAEESDADIIWMHREGIKGYTITATLSDEVCDFIEKFQEENS